MTGTFNNSKTTFWDLINSKTIVIPQIQRDYAQGREDADVIDLRKRLLNKMHDAISDLSPVDLDFVYGYDISNEFIPLDGQQRLTTLFLIHWYIAKRSQADLSPFRNFRYETRQSSSDFIKTLLTTEIDFTSQKNVKSWIMNRKWFYHTWQKDPTVTGMLSMIQDIHEKFEHTDFNRLWYNLTHEKPITFNSLSMGEIGLTDELYIKMNSRGKPLTRFENFKVWFEKKKYPSISIWKEKIDNEWTNLFWYYRNSFNSGKIDEITIDDEFMQFINGMLMIGLAKKENKTEVQFFANNTEIPLSKYEDAALGFFSEEEVSLIMKTLDWFSTYHHIFKEVEFEVTFWDEKSIFEIFISEKLTYPDRVQFFSIVHYISQLSSDALFSKELFIQWLRVSRNLIQNTTIDSPDTFIDAINAITELSDNCLDIYGYLLNSSSSIAFFKTQFEEEKIKATLLVEEPTVWTQPILTAESHVLFRGNIGFILNSEVPLTIEHFQAKYTIANTIFDQSGSKEEFKKDYLFTRALLAESSIENNIRLIDNAANWRVLLKRNDVQIAFANISDRIMSNPDSEYSSIFNTLINNYSDQSILWRYSIIKNKILLATNASISKAIKHYGKFVYLFNNEGANWINNDNQFLLSNFRNECITALIDTAKDLELFRTGDWWIYKDPESKNVFYRGENIWLKKQLGNYNLWLQFTPSDLIIGFHNDDEEIIQIEENNLSLIHGWLVAKNIGNYPVNREYIASWIQTVLTEIALIEPMASSKVK